jgi:A/G-specific adenine glycosylase
MAVLRAAQGPVPRSLFSIEGPYLSEAVDGSPKGPVRAQLDGLHALQAGESQLERAIDGLLHDGLAQTVDAGIQLPA